MEKRDTVKAAISQCYSVSVCLCHHDRSTTTTVGNPEQLSPRGCTQGLYMLTDRAKGCAVHSISQSAVKPYSLTAYLIQTANLPVFFTSMCTENILLQNKY